MHVEGTPWAREAEHCSAARPYTWDALLFLCNGLWARPSVIISSDGHTRTASIRFLDHRRGVVRYDRMHASNVIILSVNFAATLWARSISRLRGHSFE